MILQKISGVVN